MTYFLQSETKFTRHTPTTQHSRRRRSKIPERPQTSISLWSIVRNCIGKELTKIPMPVCYFSKFDRLLEELGLSRKLF